MRLCYVFDENLPSSATDTEQVNSTLAALSRKGVDCELILPQRQGTAKLSGELLRRHYQVEGNYEVRQVPAALSFARPLEKLLHAHRGVAAVGSCDLVYTRNLATVEAALLAGHRVMYEHYRPWPDQYPPLEPWLRQMFRHDNLLGVVSHSRLVEQCYERLDIPKERLLVAHNGYEPRRMLPRLEIADARRLLELPQDRPLVVYTGRVKVEKGIRSILALARAMPDVGFVIVGAEGNGVIEQEARALTNVIVRPWVPFDVTVQYLYAANVLIVPPTLEPLKAHGTTVLPMKLFQYLASGRAILAPAAPDTSELLRHEHNSILVEPDNVAAQLAALKSLLTTKELWERVVRGALEDSRHMTWDARAERLIEFMQARLNAAPTELPKGQWSSLAWMGRTLRYVGRQLR